MKPEFAAVSPYGVNDPVAVFLAEEDNVTITAVLLEKEPAERFLAYWRDYLHNSDEWLLHKKEETPLSSLFRGSYMNIEAHPYTEDTKDRYEDMLGELKSQGKVRTIFVDA